MQPPPPGAIDEPPTPFAVEPDVVLEPSPGDPIGMNYKNQFLKEKKSTPTLGISLNSPVFDLDGQSSSPSRRQPRNNRRTRSGPLKQREIIRYVTEITRSFRHMDIVSWTNRHCGFTIHDQNKFEKLLADFYGVNALSPAQLRNIRRQFRRQGFYKSRLSENSFRFTLRQYSPAIDSLCRSDDTTRSGTGNSRERSYSF